VPRVGEPAGTADLELPVTALEPVPVVGEMADQPPNPDHSRGMR
jgi:hypothetical protein